MAERGQAGIGTSEQRPADLKSARQIAVQNAVQTVFRDTLEPPKTTLSPPYSTTTYTRLECVTNRLLYQLSYVGLFSILTKANTVVSLQSSVVKRFKLSFQRSSRVLTTDD